MATGKVTKRSVEAVAIPAEGKRAHLWDDTLKGFGVMVTDKGVRSYIVQYRIWGRGSPSRRVTIGKHGSPWTADTARDYAEDILQLVRRKIDPFDAQKEAKALAEQAKADLAATEAIKVRLAFNAIADRYIEQDAKNRLRTWKDIKSVIDRDLTPKFGTKPLTDIEAADIAELLNDVSERGDGAARAAYSALSSVFRFAAEKEKRYFKASDSPMRDVQPPAKADKRQRILADAELRLIWESAGGLGWPFCEIIKLLMLTGQRLREVAHATWNEFDLEKAEWLIPGERTKNKLPMVVHLSKPAVQILKSLPVVKCKKGYLFTTTGKTAVSGFSRAKGRIDTIMLKAQQENELEALPEWRLHDLRRTMSTYCQRLRIAPQVIELMQNHVEGARSGTKGSYQLYQYAAERRAGFTKWGATLLAIVQTPQDAAKVVPMRARK